MTRVSASFVSSYIVIPIPEIVTSQVRIYDPVHIFITHINSIRSHVCEDQIIHRDISRLSDDVTDHQSVSKVDYEDYHDESIDSVLSRHPISNLITLDWYDERKIKLESRLMIFVIHSYMWVDSGSLRWWSIRSYSDWTRDYFWDCSYRLEKRKIRWWKINWTSCVSIIISFMKLSLFCASHPRTGD